MQLHAFTYADQSQKIALKPFLFLLKCNACEMQHFYSNSKIQEQDGPERLLTSIMHLR